MKGLKFYLEYPNNKNKREGTRKKLGNHSGNVIAVIDNTYHVGGTGKINADAIGAVFFHSNSAVVSTGVSDEYLREKCKRISEEQARKIHPKLFNYLDD